MYGPYRQSLRPDALEAFITKPEVEEESKTLDQELL
jgi:hypothetical protein